LGELVVHRGPERRVGPGLDSYQYTDSGHALSARTRELRV
jgi:hypothetical protein